MNENRLTIRSAKARGLARRLAQREKRSIADVVERAPELHETRKTRHDSAALFYARLSAIRGTDIDLEAIICEAHRVHPGPCL